MWRLIKAAAIFHPSGPKDLNGTTTMAARVPRIVATANPWNYHQHKRLVTDCLQHKMPHGTLKHTTNCSNFILSSTWLRRTWIRPTWRVKCVEILPDPMQKTVRRRPVEAKTRRISAAKRRSGTARGRRNLFTMVYVGESAATRPTLLAASPTSVLTSAPLSALPHCVFSDLHIHHECQYHTVAHTSYTIHRTCNPKSLWAQKLSSSMEFSQFSTCSSIFS